ncbi:hypothetical protein NKH19_08195 [Mesorhizobium sp. M1338]|uniref:hypothetical protein n=1 Tax=unclassified Mesorhizobium TaxID=325217 RepID=UPI00333970A6
MPVDINIEAALKRRALETPLETAARLRAEFGIELSKQVASHCEPGLRRVVWRRLMLVDGVNTVGLTDLETVP